MKKSEVVIKRIMNAIIALTAISLSVTLAVAFAIVEIFEAASPLFGWSIVGIGLSATFLVCLVIGSFGYIMFGNPKIWHDIPSDNNSDD